MERQIYVLVIDDVPASGDAVVMELNRNQIKEGVLNVVPTTNLADARSKLKDGRNWCLIVLDLALNGSDDGASFLGELMALSEEDGPVAGIPVMVVSAVYTKDEDASGVLQSGACDYFRKPITATNRKEFRARAAAHIATFVRKSTNEFIVRQLLHDTKNRVTALGGVDYCLRTVTKIIDAATKGTTANTITELEALRKILSPTATATQVLGDFVEVMEKIRDCQLGSSKLDVYSLVNGVILECAQQSQAFNVSVSNEVKGHLNFNEVMLKSIIFYNLIDNAIKFSRPGKPVRVYSEWSEKENGLYIRVEGHSGPIPGALLKQMLSSSAKLVPLAGNGGRKGSGIGLKGILFLSRCYGFGFSIANKGSDEVEVSLFFPRRFCD